MNDRIRGYTLRTGQTEGNPMYIGPAKQQMHVRTTKPLSERNAWVTDALLSERGDSAAAARLTNHGFKTVTHAINHAYLAGLIAAEPVVRRR